MTKKRWMILIGLVNILLIGLYGVLIFILPQNSVYADYNTEWNRESERCLVYSTPEMRRGVYTVTVRYEADNNTYNLSCVTDAFTDGSAYPVVYVENYQLNSQQNNLSFRLWVNSNVDYLLFHIKTESPSEDINIERIYIEREFKETLMYFSLQLCVFLFFADIIATVIAFRRTVCQKIKEDTYVILGLFIIFCICSFSLISNYQTWGHDMVFHLARIVGLEEGILTGNFPVRIQPGWCNDYGYAVSVFYGDLLLYIPALLYMAWVPLVYSYKFYVLCINVGTIGIAYFCYKRLSHDKHIGVVCTALYCLSINRILNVFVRAAVGEYSAYMFYPLVLLGVKEILCMDTKENSEKHGWVFLCIGMTGLIQTHVLSVEMTCIILGILVIALNRRLLHLNIILAFLKSIIATICINLGFILPFLDYSRQNLMVFQDKDTYGIQGYGLSLHELFSFGTSAAGVARLSLEGLWERFPSSLGLGIIIVLVLAFIALTRFMWEEKRKKRLLFTMGIAAVVLFMSTHYFPWNKLAAISYVRSLVSSIQFPWRFVSISMPILIYVACLVFMQMRESIPQEKTKYALMGIFLITALQGMFCVDLSVRGSNYVKYDGQVVLSDINSVSSGEYLFENTDKYIISSNHDVAGQNVSILNAERKGNQVVVTCEAGQDAYLEIPLFAYKYYRCVDVATKEEFYITKGGNNQIHVDLPSGYKGDVMVYYEEPWHWRIAEIISLITFFAFVIYIICLYKTKKIY